MFKIRLTPSLLRSLDIISYKKNNRFVRFHLKQARDELLPGILHRKISGPPIKRPDTKLKPKYLFSNTLMLFLGTSSSSSISYYKIPRSFESNDLEIIRYHTPGLKLDDSLKINFIPLIQLLKSKNNLLLMFLLDNGEFLENSYCQVRLPSYLNEEDCFQICYMLSPRYSTEFTLKKVSGRFCLIFNSLVIIYLLNNSDLPRHNIFRFFYFKCYFKLDKQRLYDIKRVYVDTHKFIYT